MRVGYFDCFSGASGDMILAACLDAGLDLDQLRADLKTLGLKGYTLKTESALKQGFFATRFDVVLDSAEPQPHRNLNHISDIIANSRLPDHVRSRALSIFTRLAESEAIVHGTTVDKIHFHEVGAIDSIIDIVGSCLALDRLGIEEVYCSAIPTGTGTVRCQHGLLPVPAPVTALLLKGVPLADCDEEGELITPTGAAILTTLTRSFRPLPAMTIESVGVGGGRREGKNRPNILRLIIGRMADSDSGDAESDEIIELKANLDDTSAEVIGYVYDRLFKAGALDVFTTPIYMKKNRPGSLLTVLAPAILRETIEAILFSETTTFGVRCQTAQRRKLARTVETVMTEYGPVRIKVGRQGDRVVAASPEYEDCREAASRTGKPLSAIMELALQAWRKDTGS
ncbi:MAG: nickel pincer cofactor biosynthesis protein LarC [Planctomycetota bacterium]|jgi:uncharacterized protein (TIGR00299 family) protein